MNSFLRGFNAAYLLFFNLTMCALLVGTLFEWYIFLLSSSDILNEIFELFVSNSVNVMWMKFMCALLVATFFEWYIFYCLHQILLMKYSSYFFQILCVLCEWSCIVFQMVLVLIFFLGEKKSHSNAMKLVLIIWKNQHQIILDLFFSLYFCHQI